MLKNKHANCAEIKKATESIKIVNGAIIASGKGVFI